MRTRTALIPATVLFAARAAALAAALALGACSSGAVTETPADDPATVEPVAGTGVVRITLSSDAARRLDIRTAAVERLRNRSGGHELRIPYAAVLYDPDGTTWTYTAPEPLVFERAPIRIDRIAGDSAVLSAGPSLGTEVVTVGAAELLGTEYGVGEE